MNPDPTGSGSTSLLYSTVYSIHLILYSSVYCRYSIHLALTLQYSVHLVPYSTQYSVHLVPYSTHYSVQLALYYLCTVYTTTDLIDLCPDQLFTVELRRHQLLHYVHQAPEGVLLVHE